MALWIVPTQTFGRHRHHTLCLLGIFDFSGVLTDRHRLEVRFCQLPEVSSHSWILLAVHLAAGPISRSLACVAMFDATKLGPGMFTAPSEAGEMVEFSSGLKGMALNLVPRLPADG